MLVSIKVKVIISIFESQKYEPYSEVLHAQLIEWHKNYFYSLKPEDLTDMILNGTKSLFSKSCLELLRSCAKYNENQEFEFNLDCAEKKKV